MFSDYPISRIASIVFVLVVSSVAYWTTTSVELVARLLVSLIFPVACIWYAEELGRLTGISGSLFGPRIGRETPGIAVAAAGWVLALTIVFVAWLVA